MKIIFELTGNYLHEVNETLKKLGTNYEIKVEAPLFNIVATLPDDLKQLTKEKYDGLEAKMLRFVKDKYLNMVIKGIKVTDVRIKR